MNLEGRTLEGYEIGPELGRGGMGAVYRATATFDGAAGPAGTCVAIKHFHPHLVEDARAFERFVREAEVGRSIRHPHVVRTFELRQTDVDGSPCHFMVMEFIDGQTLKDLLEELGTVPEQLLFTVADQALNALAEIHGRGVIHRDIKPENIVITGEHRVLLMDLGVARLAQSGQTMTEAGEFVGSLAYAAPEQFGSEDGIGPAADLYAFGVVLYELVTGKNPFDVSEISLILQQKLYGDIGPPSHVSEEVSPFLDEVILCCLQRESTSRFSSAEELRAILRDGERSAWWRERSRGIALPGAERALKRLRLVRETSLVGRDKELGRFHKAYREAESDGGRVLLVGGAAGLGKSRLVYQGVEALSSATGPRVLAGRAVGSGGRAYQPFLEVVQDMVGFDQMDVGERRAQLELELAQLLPDTPAVVPHVAEFLLAGLQQDNTSGFSKDAALSAFASLLRNAAARRPLVVVIEDLQLAGPETLDLFGYLARCVPGHPILLVGVYRDDEVEDGSELHALLAALAPQEAVAALTLQPLPRRACDDIVFELTFNENTVRSIGNMLYEKSEGNPNVVLEMFLHLKSTGALVERDERIFVEGPTQMIALPSSITDLFALKLGRLDEGQRETLEAAAVVGHEFSTSLLAAVLEERKIKLLKRLAVLERTHRLIESAGKDAFRFAKRQIRDSVYQDIGPDLRTEYHAVVADAIEEQLQDTPEVSGERAHALLHHLTLAEQSLRAVPYLEPALDFLLANTHANDAAPLLEQLDAEFLPAPPNARFSIAMGRWALYERMGQAEDQQAALTRAQGFAEQMNDVRRRAQVHCCLAVTNWRVGDQAAAETEAETGLKLARDAADGQWEGNALHTLGATAYSRGDFLLCHDRWQEALAVRRGNEDRRGIASSLQALGAVMRRIRRPGDEIYRTRLEALEIFRTIGDRPGECRQLTNVGNSLQDYLRHEEALDHFDRAIQLSRELGNLQSEAFPLANRTHSLVALGRLEDARESAERAVRVLTEVGNRAMQSHVMTLLGSILDTVGEHEAARTQLEAAVALAEKVNAKDRRARALATLGLVRHGGGARDEGWQLIEEALATQDNPATRFDLLGLAARAALIEEDVPRALAYLHEQHELGSASDMLADERALLLARLAHAAAATGDPETAAARVAEAREVVEAAPAAGTPEVWFHLAGASADAERGRRCLATAAAQLDAMGRKIRNDGYREHFLARTWPNATIRAATESDRA